MRFLLHRSMLVWAIGIVGVFAVACGSNPNSDVPVSPTTTPVPTQATASPTPVPSPTAASAKVAIADEQAEPEGYTSNNAMYKVFPGFGFTSEDTFVALEEVREQEDESLVPVLVESLRFQSSERAREATASVLQDLTGQALGGEQWQEWSEWFGKNRDAFPPPDKYLDWKIRIMSQADPGFVRFLRPALKGQIAVDPTELVWGGVPPDGIPDLRNPSFISPDESDYLADDERVFGISINGENKAYPLRITNAHEMVNDTVGGEPISLSW